MFAAIALAAAALSTVAAAIVTPQGRTIELADTKAQRKAEKRALRYGWNALAAGMGL